MPATGHVHQMTPIAWTSAGSDFPPGVLLCCTKGVCAKTEAVYPKKQSRKVPVGLTQEQFDSLKAGRFWPEIVEQSEIVE